MVGAARQLRDFKSQLDSYHENIQCLTTLLNITWNFISPRAPDFGGLWVNDVKAMKHYLKRVLGNQTFTLEEMMTTLCQIEACLNSRLLYKLTDDPIDLEVLTSNHFLIGQTTVHILAHYRHSKEMLLKRWNLMRGCIIFGLNGHGNI